jgi:hypothetical protein
LSPAQRERARLSVQSVVAHSPPAVTGKVAAGPYDPPGACRHSICPLSRDCHPKWPWNQGWAVEGLHWRVAGADPLRRADLSIAERSHGLRTVEKS